SLKCATLLLLPPLFPTRRSSDLVAGNVLDLRFQLLGLVRELVDQVTQVRHVDAYARLLHPGQDPDEGSLDLVIQLPEVARLEGVDRKSTRLNSSHDQTTYAVFCL